jgi:phenylalanyl-tRNA synthetase alpha chain
LIEQCRLRFQLGIDRIAVLKCNPDLRAFFESDLRWLRHYRFSALRVPTVHGVSSELATLS